MALDILNTVDIIELMENFLEQIRPPEEIRKELDIGYKIENQSIILVQIRPLWNNPSEYAEYGFAKTTFVKNKNKWKIFWLRSDLKWHTYLPEPEVNTIKEFLEIVYEDRSGCFLG